MVSCPDLGCDVRTYVATDLATPGFRLRVATGVRTARGEQCRSVTALPPEVRRAAEPVGVGGFEIGYVTDDGLEHRVSLSQAWATPFESCSPIRRFTSHKGQRI